MHRSPTLSNPPNSFGSIIEGRSYEGDTSLRYRFGFNGKEKDDETYRVGNCIAFEKRIYDSRLGRFLSTDPREKEYPWQSTYIYYANSPIIKLDHLGGGANPIIDQETGEVLGTDENGWKGEAIVMDKKDFKPGMKHSEAENKGQYLTKYSEPIKISYKTWAKINDNGGQVYNPSVSNNSNETIYYKPEGVKDGVDSNPGKEQSEAYAIPAGKDLYARVDGVKTSKMTANEVCKLPDNGRVTIDAEGDTDIFNFPDWTYGYGIITAPDNNWYELRDSFK